MDGELYVHVSVCAKGFTLKTPNPYPDPLPLTLPRYNPATFSASRSHAVERHVR